MLKLFLPSNSLLICNIISSINKLSYLIAISSNRRKYEKIPIEVGVDIVKFGTTSITLKVIHEGNFEPKLEICFSYTIK